MRSLEVSPLRRAYSLRRPASFALINKSGARLKSSSFLLVVLARNAKNVSDAIDASAMDAPFERVPSITIVDNQLLRKPPHEDQNFCLTTPLQDSFKFTYDKLVQWELKRAPTQREPSLSQNQLPANNFFFAIKATKRIGSSVVRNKIKRRIRHVIRLLLSNGRLHASYRAVIIIPYKGIDSVTFAELYQSFAKLLGAPLKSRYIPKTSR
ncbi:Ribonuclease P protein component [Rickettsiales endosymbiont of Paramecium tredecaurelia]|nr:Ribonuclease P protein component [Candidatus Sarmatiella mevalonica]